eukprot:RCo030901
MGTRVHRWVGWVLAEASLLPSVKRPRTVEQSLTSYALPPNRTGKCLRAQMGGEGTGDSAGGVPGAVSGAVSESANLRMKENSCSPPAWLYRPTSEKKHVKPFRKHAVSITSQSVQSNTREGSIP